MKKHRINKTNIIIILLAIAFIILTIFGAIVNEVFKSYKRGRAPYKYSEGMDEEFFPYDENEAKIIDDSKPNNDGETWAIYMYLVGSNLELSGHSQLSDFVEYIAKASADERIENEKIYTTGLFKDFLENEEKNNIPFPISFYDADYKKGAKTEIPEEKHEVSETAWGSAIMDVFRQAELPDNVTFVVQPGGATAWKDTQVNPNRTRRFVKEGQELVEVYDAPVTNMGESETLTDFLKFCKEKYPADHTMVILTNHGGAMTGFGWESIYGDDSLTLKELAEGFDNAYGINEENPPVDVLYFNACLMSNTDVINSMRGVAEYMIAGEEVGLSVSKYYGTLCERLCENPNMNAKQLGKTLIDCYSRELTSNGALIGAPQQTGMCLLDMNIAPRVYDAYANLAKQMLSDVADNPRLLARLSRNVSESISFAVDSYKRYNCTDLWLWINGLSDIYPNEAKEIKELIDEAVIYKRADGYIRDAHGISVYFPNYIEDLPSLRVALKYIDSISYSEDISALYYYKLAGCLNEKYTEYCENNGIKVPGVIDYNAMGILRNSKITAIDENGNVKARISKAVYPILSDVRYELSKVDEIYDTVTCYGEDEFAAADGDNGVKTVFEGKWVTVGGTPLYVRVINSYDDYFVYESPVIYRDYEYRLILQCEANDETMEDEFTILGLRHPDDEAATIDRNVVELMPGSYITPIYYESAISGGEITQTKGRAILYSANTRIQDEKLEKGKYRVRLVYENMRGEDVYSEPEFFEVQ